MQHDCSRHQLATNKKQCNQTTGTVTYVNNKRNGEGYGQGPIAKYEMTHQILRTKYAMSREPANHRQRSQLECRLITW